MKFVNKGWGHEKWVHNSKDYCGKLLFLESGKKCSLHFHKLKKETFFISSGKVRLTWSDDVDLIKHCVSKGLKHLPLNEIILGKGDKFEIPIGRVHQIYALEDTEIFEFSTQHFDSDSHRILKGD